MQSTQELIGMIIASTIETDVATEIAKLQAENEQIEAMLTTFLPFQDVIPMTKLMTEAALGDVLIHNQFKIDALKLQLGKELELSL